MVVGLVGGPGLQAVEVPGAGDRQQGDHASQQDQVADPLGKEGIAGPLHHQGLVVPGAHDQVGAQGEQLHDHVAEEQRIGEHQGTQARFKEAQGAEETGPAPVHLQVGDRIDLHQHMQAGDQRHRDQGGFGDQTVEADAQAGGLQPGPAEGERLVDGRRARGGIGMESHQSQHAVHKGHAHQQEIEITAGPRSGAGNQPRRPQQGEQRGQQGIQGHQPGRLGKKQGHGSGGKGSEKDHWPRTLRGFGAPWVASDRSDTYRWGKQW